MVDAIKHNVRQMVAPAPQDAKSAPSRSAVASMGAVPDAQIAAEDSQVSVKASVSSLAQTPPINMEAVSRIKQAIADGKYPINLDLVSERLMESYIEMKG
ncbi:MAG: flagellar biosynthesis anti-sigma factor FlgM [Orrella sp.]